MMLSREVMGVALLCVLWAAALLVAGAGWQDIRDLLRRRRALRPLADGESGEGMIEGSVSDANGEGGALASFAVEQVGRAQDADVRTIAFADRVYRSAVFGGKVRAGAREVTVCPTEGDAVEVWTTDAERAAAGRCPGAEAFDRAYADAKKARGHVRELTVRVRGSDRVFLFGRLEQGGDAWSIGPASDGTLLVATFDPRSFCKTHATRIALFVVLELAACAGITRLALWEPRFGTVSTLGAALGLAFFLLATPLGVRLRQAARLPHRAVVRGTWTEPRGSARTAENAAA
jgi:hypothetical protein